jgi:hypothetical protein
MNLPQGYLQQIPKMSFLCLKGKLLRANWSLPTSTNLAVHERDSTYRQLVSELGGEDQVLAFRQKYYNKQLASVVTQEKEIQYYILRNGEMISKKNAVYREPIRNNGRAHFYAPFKRIFNREVDTFWFNLIWTWIFNLMSLIFLYFDAIRKILDYIETLL